MLVVAGVLVLRFNLNSSATKITWLMCRCARFFGFHGEYCTKLSFASYFNVALSVISGVCAVYVFGKSYLLYVDMKTADRLHHPAVFWSLFFNSLGTLPTLFFDIMFILTISGSDSRMVLFEYAVAPCVCLLSVFFVGSMLSISLVWINGVVREETHLFRYRMLLFSASMIAVVLVLLCTVVLRFVSGAIIVGCLYGMVTVGVFRHVGRMVYSTLEAAQLSVVRRLEMAQTVRRLSLRLQRCIIIMVRY